MQGYNVCFLQGCKHCVFPPARICFGLLGFLILGATELAYSNAFFEKAQITQPKQSMAAPPFSLPDLEANEVTLADYKGKVVLLNFWATFCGPCREEMPALERLWRQREALNLVVLGINVNRDNLHRVAPFVEETQLSFPILMDASGEVRNLYEVTALPYSYLIDVDGKILGRYIGAKEWDSEEIEALLRSLRTR